MQRREILQAVALLLGNVVLSPAVARVLDGYVPQARLDSIFKPSEVALMTEIADTIIPETTTPGAKAAGVGEFIKLMIDDCYKPEDQQAFRAGLAEVDKQAQGLYKKNYVDCDKKARVDILQRMEAQAYADRQQAKSGLNFWFTVKELTLTGYFTSEIGAKQALEYVYVPAKYEACIDLKPGQKAWALS
ncbi:MAG: gluconate 2-dehydrogenase subunit 3 family protein [Microscillaceae bacterium]|nr:gluconate 2-dehydrogenase subunit 3 family protein [Microscillaceae bacterium]